MKTCRQCGETKDFSCFGIDRSKKSGVRHICRECVKKYMVEYNRSPSRRAISASVERKAKLADQHLKRRYGVTSKDKQRIMAEQLGVCAVCKTPFDGPRDSNLDHNHVTGQVRGVLCRKCNIAAGHLNDSSQRAAGMLAYLSHWESRAER